MSTQHTADPKEGKITNQDTAITNKDLDNDVDSPEEVNVQDKPDAPRVKTVTPANQNTDPGETEEEDVDPSNTHDGPAGENL